MSYRDELDRINSVYCNSVDAVKLKKELGALEKMISDGYLTDANLKNARAMYYRLSLKYGLLRLLSSFDKKKYDALRSFIAESYADAFKKSYKNTCAAMEKAREIVDGLKAFAVAADGFENGFAEGGAANALRALEKFNEDDDGFCNPFGGAVKFTDIKADIARLKKDFTERLERRRIYEVESKVGHLIKEVSGKYLLCEYYPLPEPESGEAGTEVIFSPFAEESRLYAVHAAGAETLYELDAARLDGTTEEFIDELFIFVNGRVKSLLILNSDGLSERRRKKLYTNALLSGGRGIKCFISDSTCGAFSLLQEIAAEEKYSAGGLAYTYLTVPPFADVCEELARKGMICGESDCDKLRAMPFTGFTGLNKMVAAHAAGRDWFAAGKGVSDENERCAREYLEYIDEQQKFIDGGWGAFPVGGKARLESESDGLYGVPYEKRDGVNAVLSSGYTVFAKCGMVARLLCDFNGDFSPSTVENGITAAVKLIYKLMRIPFTPEVVVSDALENPTAGALCSARGRRLSFRYDCCRQFEWLRNAVVHESFHGLQSVLMEKGWDEWYFENLGITEGRLKSWADTAGIYDGNTASDLYRVHIKEQDAYAFQGDCTRLGDEAWDKLFK